MRETERLIEVDKVVKEDVLLNREEITSYTVDKRNQRITIELQLSGDDTRYVETEVHRFFSGQFIKEPTEEDLWKLVDEKRRGV